MNPSKTRSRQSVRQNAARTNSQVPDLDAMLALCESGECGLLGDVVTFIRQYVVMTPAQLVAAALWVVHTHAVMAAEQTPYLVITSPEKQCGKTRLLEVLNLLVARSWSTVLPSEAVIYRTVHSNAPTLLLDEIDTVFNPRSADKHEGLRALINAGNRRSATVPRCIGQSGKVADFRVYCAKALAGMGTLPDTIADRALPIRLKRRAKTEPVERFHRRAAEPAGYALKQKVAEWAKQSEKKLSGARPKSPDSLSDRQQDACEPLFAIADRFGSSWRQWSRMALVELCTEERADDTESMRLRLLKDIKATFLASPKRRSFSTEQIITALCAIEESPWSNYYGRPIDARDLAALLKPYGVHPVNVRFKDKTVRKGYKRMELEDAWRRYT